MSDTIRISVCPKCQAPIPAEAPQGLCPKCVLGGAASPTEAGGSATATGEIPTIPRIAAAFPQLEIIELIGRGGMGFVFKARQPHLDRFVALKLLPDKLAKDPHFAERFNREGRVLAKLNHPNIVSIFDFGQTSDFYFLLMEYVDGVNLRQAMRAGRFSPAEALGIVPKVCEALQYAHEQGVLHRDIKPENILLDAKGRVKIADFGIAKLVGEDAPAFMLTGTGHALGTPHYMAPEQLEKPGEVDHRADIYSLGVVFYEMLTGELPIGRFAAPSTKTPVDQRVDEIVFRALEKERELRQKNVTEFRTQVENVTSTPRAASAEMPPARAASAVAPKWSQKAVWAAGLTALSLPLPLLMMVVAYFGSRGMIALEIAIALAAISLPGLAGAILGWMALSDIRAHQGQLRGLPLAVFAALTWPLLLLVGGMLVIPSMIAYRAAGPGGSLHLAAMLMSLVPVGAITFAIWAVYAAARWGGNKAASERRRGVLKWVFLALLFFGVGIVLTTRLRGIRNEAKVSAQVVSAETNATPWIRFTFTAVELREVAGVRWLAIDYVDDVHGECQKSFPWETTIPGFKAQTRATEFVTDAKDSSPAVRHQRIEYRMPDSSPREQLERLRDELEKTLKQKSFRLELGENQVPLQLFELPGAEGGSLKARIKVMPPLKANSDGLLATANAVGSPRKVELRIPTITDDPYKSVGVTTESELPVGDYLVGLLQRPDGRVEEKPAVVTVYRRSGRISARAMKHVLWPMSQFESNRVREIVAEMRATLDGRVIELLPDGRSPVFQATNAQGAITKGFIALRSQNLSATDLPPVTVSVAEVPQNWGPFLSVKIRVSAPPGYYPNAVGLLDDGSEVETHTSIMGGGRGNAWSGDTCAWYFPHEFQASDVGEIVRQLESTKVTSPNGIRILPGQRVPVFSVTNHAGTVFRGYFQLPALGPSATTNAAIASISETAATRLMEFSPTVEPTTISSEAISLAQSGAFGAVMERTIKLGEVKSDGLAFLNLEKAELMPSPFLLSVNLEDQGIFQRSQRIDEWISASGVDLALHLTDKNWGYTALGMRLVYDKSKHDDAACLTRFSPEEARTLIVNPTARTNAYSVFGGRASDYVATTCYVFKTRRGAIGLLQMTSFTNDVPGVKIRYTLLNPPHFADAIAAESWAPPVADGEKPRPYEILQEADRLTRQGRYEEALQRHLWYHNHALEFEPSQAGVRLSFALTQWLELARRYPRAKDALVEIRDKNVREFSDSGGSFRAFTEISFINKALKEDYATIGLFKSIQARNPRLARQCYQLVEDSLVETGEYAVCESFIPDIQKRFDEIRAKREKFLEEGRKKAAPAALRQVAQQNFIKETRSLVEILVGVGRKSEAEAIRDQAIAVLNVAELQSAVSDAEKKVAKHFTVNTGANPTNTDIGWLRGTWIYDKEYSTKKTAELRAATAAPQKSLQDVVNSAQKSGGTNGVPDVSKIAGELTAVTVGMMANMKDSMELQLVLDLLTGTQLTFDETEVHSISRLSTPATIPYDEVKVINATTMQVRWQGTNGGVYFREGERFRFDLPTPNNSFALYFKRLQTTNTVMR